MESTTAFTFEDALANTTVTLAYPGLETKVVAREGGGCGGEGNGYSCSGEGGEGGEGESQPCTSLFFPGCSFMNYGLPLVELTYDLLRERGAVNGISLLCCGKILAYEPGANVVRPAFEQQFCDRIAQTSITRMVAACPNCVLALRHFLAADERTANIEVVPLTSVFAELGLEISAESAAACAQQDAAPASPAACAPAAALTFSIKDTCPDRETGEFADGLRRLVANLSWVDPEHNRESSICCGSLPRAAGQIEAAYKCCAINHEEAKAAGANAIVTPCMSCTYLLSALGQDLPVFHYLELFFGQRINWTEADQFMKLRFLFENAESGRQFQGLNA